MDEIELLAIFEDYVRSREALALAVVCERENVQMYRDEVSEKRGRVTKAIDEFADSVNDAWQKDDLEDLWDKASQYLERY